MRLSSSALRHALRIGLLVVVAAFVVLALIHEWHRLGTSSWRFQPAWIPLVVASLVILQLTTAELWCFMLGSLGSPIPHRHGRSIWNVTLLARYVPTSVLMAVTRIAMAQKVGVPKRICLASIVYELALMVASSLAIGAYFIVTLPSAQHDPARWSVVAIPAVALICLHPRIFHVVTDALLVKLGREKLPLSLPYSRVLAYFCVYAAGFALAGFGTAALAQALHPVSAGDIPTLVGSFAIAFAASVIAFILPAGLGARETAMAAALAPVLPLGVGIAVAVLLRLIQIGVELLIASLTFLHARAGGEEGLRLRSVLGSAEPDMPPAQ